MAVRVTGVRNELFWQSTLPPSRTLRCKEPWTSAARQLYQFCHKKQKKRINQNQDLTDEGTLCELVFKRVNLLKQEYKDVSEWYEAKTL
jgi:hypothetical protein